MISAPVGFLIILGTLILIIIAWCISKDEAAKKNLPVIPVPEEVGHTFKYGGKFGSQLTDEDFATKWEKMTGEWKYYESCQCGFYFKEKRTSQSVPREEPCPRCGHTQKWSIRVARETWEEGQSVHWESYSMGSYFNKKQIPEHMMGCEFVKRRSLVGTTTRKKKLVFWSEMEYLASRRESERN